MRKKWSFLDRRDLLTRSAARRSAENQIEASRLRVPRSSAWCAKAGGSQILESSGARPCRTSVSSSRNSTREPVAEHRPPAFRLRFSRLVLEDVPVLGEAAILDPDHVSSDPCDGAALTREAPMENDIVALRQDNTGIIAESVRRASDKIE